MHPSLSLFKQFKTLIKVEYALLFIVEREVLTEYFVLYAEAHQAPQLQSYFSYMSYLSTFTQFMIGFD